MRWSDLASRKIPLHWWALADGLAFLTFVGAVIVRPLPAVPHGSTAADAAQAASGAHDAKHPMHVRGAVPVELTTTGVLELTPIDVPIPDRIRIAVAGEWGAPPVERRAMRHGAPLYDEQDLERALARAEQLTPISSLLVMRGSEMIVERYYRGMRAGMTTNMKSVSKTLLSPLIGIAIEEGLLDGPDQSLAELLPTYYERLEADGRLEPPKRDLTLHHVLSMTTGIESTSFGNYGAWVSSRDWVWDALRRPMECRPGCFEYSTGNTHILSAILTARSGQSLRSYARDRFFGPIGVPLAEWDRDPQGRYLGGNNMALRPRDLLRVGEVFLAGGRWEGRQLVPEAWIRESWRPNARSPWNGHRYGYLWWTDEWGGETAYFAWGYGGQYLVIVPSLDLVAVVTSSLARTQGGHTRRLRDFFDDYLIPAFAD